jgi:hypothetical protein
VNENDKAIEKVLQGLRDAKPVDGYESRLVTSVRRRALDQPAKGTLVAHRPVLAFVLFAAFLVTAAVAFHYRWSGRDPGHPRSVENAGLEQPSRPGPSVSTPQQPSRVIAPRLVKPAPKAATKHALEKATPVNIPAPPEPLTDQEKLLLRVARIHDAGNTTLLNEQARSARRAQETEQFQNFFAMNAQEKRTQLE